MEQWVCRHQHYLQQQRQGVKTGFEGHLVALVLLDCTLYVWASTGTLTGYFKRNTQSVAQEQKRKFPASCSVRNATGFIVGHNKHESLWRVVHKRDVTLYVVLLVI